MIDWTRGYAQSFEYWLVDKATWQDGELLGTVSSCSSVEDSDDKLHQRADLDIVGPVPDESVIRAYMTVEQDGERVRECLGTWMAQSTDKEVGSNSTSTRITCYGLLKAVNDDMPPVGFSVPKGANCVAQAEYALSHGIAPVVASDSDKTLSRPWVAEPDSTTWLDVAIEMAKAADMQVGSDAYGNSTVNPVPGAALPAWTFADDEESVALPGAGESFDWDGIPNAVELVWTGPPVVVGLAENNDPSSPLSIQARGRRVVLRETDPSDLASNPTKATANILAEKRLKEESAPLREVSFEHAWVPVSVGQTVRLEWRDSGFAAEGKVVRREATHATGMTVKDTVRSGEETRRAE